MYKRPLRGLLSRPTVAEIFDYRAHVDLQMDALIADSGDDPKFAFLLDLGLNHEQQHQELILTDIKHALSLNPLKPTVGRGSVRIRDPRFDRSNQALVEVSPTAWFSFFGAPPALRHTPFPPQRLEELHL